MYTIKRRGREGDLKEEREREVKSRTVRDVQKEERVKVSAREGRKREIQRKENEREIQKSMGKTDQKEKRYIRRKGVRSSEPDIRKEKGERER